jgi:hypothetical protein
MRSANLEFLKNKGYVERNLLGKIRAVNQRCYRELGANAV